MKKNKKILSAYLFMLCLLSCQKQTEVNPHDGVSSLDCRNLIVRSILLTTDKKIKVTVENLCTTNCSGSVYTGLLLTDRNSTNDTLGVSPCLFCTNSPNNQTVAEYDLDTKLTKLPDVKNIRFAMVGLCNDMTFKQK